MSREESTSSRNERQRSRSRSRERDRDRRRRSPERGTHIPYYFPGPLNTVSFMNVSSWLFPSLLGAFQIEIAAAEVVKESVAETLYRHLSFPIRPISTDSVIPGSTCSSAEALHHATSTRHPAGFGTHENIDRLLQTLCSILSRSYLSSG